MAYYSVYAKAPYGLYNLQIFETFADAVRFREDARKTFPENWYIWIETIYAPAESDAILY